MDSGKSKTKRIRRRNKNRRHRTTFSRDWNAKGGIVFSM